MPVCLHCDVRASEKRSEDPALRLGLGYVVSRVSHEGQATLARIDMPLNLRLQREGEANVLLQRIYWRMHNASLRWVSLDVQRAKLKAYAELYELDLVNRGSGTSVSAPASPPVTTAAVPAGACARS